MKIDIMSYIMGKATGGGGGGGDEGKNAYAQDTPPSESIGQNGDYYFELVTMGYGLRNETPEEAGTSTAGWEFKTNQPLTIIGARAYARDAYTGTIKLAELTGSVLAEKSVSLVARRWVSVEFDNPVELASDNYFIIMLFGNQNTLCYSRTPVVDDRISYVCGKYGGLPGTTESGTVYSVDILFANTTPPFPLKTQYYKSDGIWVPV